MGGGGGGGGGGAGGGGGGAAEGVQRHDRLARSVRERHRLNTISASPRLISPTVTDMDQLVSDWLPSGERWSMSYV